MTYIDLLCTQCEIQFSHVKKLYTYRVKNGQSNFFCSQDCCRLWKHQHSTTNVTCEYCGLSAEKKKNLVGRGRFCSGTCANMAEPRRHRRNPSAAEICPTCDGLKTYKSEVCRSCRSANKNKEIDGLTLAEVRQLVKTSYEFHAKLRGWARRSYTGPKKCFLCDYDLHVDIAHIQPVSSFPLTATVGEVNATTNLVALDKRCHWEFDHGYLVL